MQNLTIDRFSSLIRTGSAKEVIAQPNPMSNGWTVNVLHNDHMLSAWIMTARGDVRVFKTADALIKAMQDVGWRNSISFKLSTLKE